jgi:hypothetical protein
VGVTTGRKKVMIRGEEPRRKCGRESFVPLIGGTVVVGGIFMYKLLHRSTRDRDVEVRRKGQVDSLGALIAFERY